VNSVSDQHIPVVYGYGRVANTDLSRSRVRNIDILPLHDIRTAIGVQPKGLGHENKYLLGELRLV
jgi:hypothetical protein